MEIDKQQLQEALEVVKPGLANKEMIEQSTSFAFIDNKVVTYNDEISVSHPVEGLNLQGAINAKDLYDFLKKLKKEKINIEIDDKEVKLSAGRIKAGLALQTEIVLPLDEDISNRKKWHDLPATFTKHINFAVGSCSDNMSQPVLTCVHVNQDGHIESSDGYRLAVCDLKEEMPVKSFLIPASSVFHLVKFAPVRVAEGTGWVHFESEIGSIMSCRIFEDKYPPISHLLNVKGEQIHLPQSIDDILERAMVFSKRDKMLEESIFITIKENRFTVKAHSDISWIEEEVNLKYSGTPIEFVVNPHLLKSILKETLVCVLSKDRLKFEGEGWEYITMLKTKNK